MTTEPTPPKDQRKPAILIGYGHFGREVLQRLLRKSAPRGALEWDLSPHGKGGIGAHRLRDLALLHIPDGRADELPDSDDAPDFILDLYRQIRVIPKTPGSNEALLCDAVTESANNLRGVRMARERQGGRGMDVLVIAQVGDPGAIGTLEHHTGALLERLVSEVPDWRVTQHAERKLNALWILDFENYRNPAMSPTRQVLAQCLDNWKQRLDDKRPGLDRCWLLDGQAHDIHRTERDRIDEVTTFLELLLFSGLRDDVPLRALFEQVQGGPNRHIAATFGIRLLERGSELLTRIAAARFGESWLAYLGGIPRIQFAREPRRTRAALSPLIEIIDPGPGADPVSADRVDPLAELDALWRDSTQRLEERLAKLHGNDQPDWIAEARAIYDEHCSALELALNRLGLELARTNREQLLGEDGGKLTDAITADLHKGGDPVPLGSILEAIDNTSEAIAGRLNALIERDLPTPTLAATAAAHRDYLAARAHWLSDAGRGLRLFWPLLAATLGLALTPSAIDVIQWLPGLAEPGSALAEGLHRATVLARHPSAVAAGLGVILWVPLATWAQGRISHSIGRARAFHADPDRGRLADALRADVARLETLLGAARANLRSALASELLQQLALVRDRLAGRGREIDWLRRQLKAFQRMQGLHDPDLAPDLSGDSAHHIVQGDREWARTIAIRPPEPANLEGRQDDLPTPFDGWNSRFCDAFLDLFPFVERLSAPYRRSLDANRIQAQPQATCGIDADTLGAFIHNPRLDLGFTVDADKSSSEPDTYCVMPPSWRGDQTLTRELKHLAGSGDRLREGKDPARLYLIKVQTNITPRALEGST